MNIMKPYLLASIISFGTLSSAYAACLAPFECARVTGMADIDMGQYDFTSNMVQEHDFCVYTQNDNDSNHALLYFGTGAGSELIATAGSTDVTGSIDVQEFGGSGWFTLTPNVKQTLPNPNTSSETCAVGGDSVTLRIRFMKTDLDQVPAGTYTGTVTLHSSLD